MDLRFTDEAATVDESDALDRILAPLNGVGIDEGWERDVGGAHRAASVRHLLLPGLHALNDRVGWISPGGLGELCRRLDVPPAEGFGVASFYGLFSMEPRPARVVHVCTDLACRIAGIDALLAELGPLDADPNARIVHSPCLGVCERAPAALVFEAGASSHEVVIAPATAAAIVSARMSGSAPDEAPIADAVPQAGSPDLVLLRRVGVVDPLSVDDFRAHGGYSALRRAVEKGPAWVLRELTESGLVGRGGAAFPAGRKWQAVAGQPVRPHHLVCNADESEPGTFKDRVLLEGDPYAVIEAMTIAAYTTGCEKGWIYLRGEYPRALHNLRTAIDRARQRGFLGADVMGLGFSFDIEIALGAGAYICGEETAIFNSIEGYRGEPRSKPPFPVEVGLFGKPTLVNNVETFVNVLPIVLGGGAAYASVGTDGSKGPKLFCVSGAVQRPGVFEVPFGTTLRSLLDLAGGVRPGRTLQAVLLGGAAGSFVRADEIDLALTFEGARHAGATLGSGVVLVLDDTVELGPFVRRIAEFFRNESCGQCVPCRVGTVRQQEAVNRLLNGFDAADLVLLRDVGQVMRDASICGLGQTAWNAIESAIDKLGVLR